MRAAKITFEGQNKQRKHCNSNLFLARFTFEKYYLPSLIKRAWKEYRINIDLFSPLCSLTAVIYNKLFANLLSNLIWKTIHHIDTSTSCLPSFIFLHWKQQRQLGRHSGQGNRDEHLLGLTPWQPRTQNIPQMLEGFDQQGAKTTLKRDDTHRLTKACRSVAQEIHQEYRWQQRKPKLPSHNKPEWANSPLFREQKQAPPFCCAAKASKSSVRTTSASDQFFTDRNSCTPFNTNSACPCSTPASQFVL